MAQRDLIVRVGANLSDFERGMAQVSSALSKVQTSADRMTAGFKRLGDHLRDLGTKLTVSVTAPLVGFGAVALRAAADMDALRRGLIAVSGSATEAERQLKRLEETAKLPGLGFREAVQAAIQLQAVGFEFERAVRIIEAIGNALAMVGRGREDLNEVIRQLGQLESRGKVTADNLRPLLERVPQLAQIMREAWGTVDPEVLTRMGVTAQQFIDTMLQGLERLPRVTGGIRNEIENMRDAMDRALARAGEALIPLATQLLQFSETAINALRAVTDWFLRLPQPVQEWTIRLIALAAAIGPVTFAAGQLVSVLTTLYKAKIVLPAVLTALTTGFAQFGQAAMVALTAASAQNLTGLTAALYTLKQAAILAAAAFAAWHLGRWIDENVVQKIPVLDRFVETLAAFPAAVYQRLTGVSGQTSAAMKDLEHATRMLEERLRAKGIVVDRTGLTTEQYAAKLRQAAKDAGLLSGGQQQVETTSVKAAVAKAKSTDAASKLARAQAEAERAARELAGALELLGVRTREQAQVEELWAAWRRVVAAYEQGKVSAEQLAAAHAGLRERLREIEQTEVDKTFSRISVAAAQNWQTLERLTDAARRYVDALNKQRDLDLPTWWDSLNQVQNQTRLTQEELTRLTQIYVGTLPEVQKKTKETTKTAGDEWSKLGRQVSTIITDMSRGIADAILKAEGFGQVFLRVIDQIAQAMLRFVVETLVGKLIGALRQLIDGELPSLAGAFKGLIGILNDVGKAFERVFAAGEKAATATQTATRGAAAPTTAPATGGFAGAVTAITSAIDAVFGGLAYFQGRRMEQDIARIEVTSRVISSHLQSMLNAANQWWPWMRNLADPLWTAIDFLSGIYDLIDRIHDTLVAELTRIASAKTQAASAEKPTVVINMTVTQGSEVAARDIANALTRQLKAAGFAIT